MHGPDHGQYYPFGQRELHGVASESVDVGGRSECPVLRAVLADDVRGSTKNVFPERSLNSNNTIKYKPLDRTREKADDLWKN